MYLAWYDASKKLSPQEKITNAYLRYQEKFGAEPAQVLLNTADVPTADLDLSLVLVPCSYIAPNCFWIGTPEDNA